MIGKWLLRIGVGAAAALVSALTQYIQGVDTSGLGTYAVAGGAIILLATWGLGALGRFLQDWMEARKA